VSDLCRTCNVSHFGHDAIFELKITTLQPERHVCKCTNCRRNLKKKVFFLVPDSKKVVFPAESSSSSASLQINNWAQKIRYFIPTLHEKSQFQLEKVRWDALFAFHNHSYICKSSFCFKKPVTMTRTYICTGWCWEEYENDSYIVLKLLHLYQVMSWGKLTTVFFFEISSVMNYCPELSSHSLPVCR
jgi:hypothetical protein